LHGECVITATITGFDLAKGSHQMANEIKSIQKSNSYLFTLLKIYFLYKNSNLHAYLVMDDDDNVSIRGNGKFNSSVLWGIECIWLIRFIQ
jgi:hypothetical protein